MSTSLNDANAVISTALPRSRSNQLPAEPVTRIRPSRFWESLDFAELWTQREVLYFLMWRDLKVRYKQTIIGAAWVIDGVPYPIFAYTALLLWTFVSNAVLSSSYSLVTNAQIITRVYFSRLLIPAAAVGVRLVDLLIATLVLIGLMIYFQVPITWNVLMFPVFVAEIAALTLAVGLICAALNVRYRDVGTMLPILLQVWMFLSPVVYSSSLIPERLRVVYFLNPLAGIIDGARASLFNLPFFWAHIAISALVTFPMLVFSIHLFRRMESSFADDV
ncbi:MAG: phosphate ABC transporter permease [Acidobacteria bacterium]|nr:MAG: phosphate ABC transporter permease [Acidobacteriota bacterium]